MSFHLESRTYEVFLYAKGRERQREEAMHAERAHT